MCFFSYSPSPVTPLSQPRMLCNMNNPHILSTFPTTPLQDTTNTTEHQIIDELGLISESVPGLQPRFLEVGARALFQSVLRVASTFQRIVPRQFADQQTNFNILVTESKAILKDWGILVWSRHTRRYLTRDLAYERVKDREFILSRIQAWIVVRIGQAGSRNQMADDSTRAREQAARLLLSTDQKRTDPLTDFLRQTVVGIGSAEEGVTGTEEDDPTSPDNGADPPLGSDSAQTSPRKRSASVLTLDEDGFEIMGDLGSLHEQFQLEARPSKKLKASAGPADSSARDSPAVIVRNAQPSQVSSRHDSAFSLSQSPMPPPSGIRKSARKKGKEKAVEPAPREEDDATTALQMRLFRKLKNIIYTSKSYSAVHDDVYPLLNELLTKEECFRIEAQYPAAYKVFFAALFTWLKGIQQLEKFRSDSGYIGSSGHDWTLFQMRIGEQKLPSDEKAVKAFEELISWKQDQASEGNLVYLPSLDDLLTKLFHILTYEDECVSEEFFQMLRAYNEELIAWLSKD